MPQACIVLVYSWAWFSELVTPVHASAILQRHSWLRMSAVGHTCTCCNYCRLGDAGKNLISEKLSNITPVLPSSLKSTELPLFQEKVFWTILSWVMFGPRKVFCDFTWLFVYIPMSVAKLAMFPCSGNKAGSEEMYGLWSVLVVLKTSLKPFQSRHCL